MALSCVSKFLIYCSSIAFSCSLLAKGNAGGIEVAGAKGNVCGCEVTEGIGVEGTFP